MPKSFVFTFVQTDAPSTTGASTFVFGSGTAFGGATGGFGAFAKPAPKEGEDDGEEGGDADPEAECKAEFKPVVQLEEVETSTGEEDEAQLLNMCARERKFSWTGKPFYKCIGAYFLVTVSPLSPPPHSCVSLLLCIFIASPFCKPQ